MTCTHLGEEEGTADDECARPSAAVYGLLSSDGVALSWVLEPEVTHFVGCPRELHLAVPSKEGAAGVPLLDPLGEREGDPTVDPDLGARPCNIQVREACGCMGCGRQPGKVGVYMPDAREEASEACTETAVSAAARLCPQQSGRQVVS